MTEKSIRVPSPSVTDLDSAALKGAVKITREPSTNYMRIIRIWCVMNSAYHYARLDGLRPNHCAVNKSVSKSSYTIALSATS
jgi:hypothetical protein